MKKIFPSVIEVGFSENFCQDKELNLGQSVVDIAKKVREDMGLKPGCVKIITSPLYKDNIYCINGIKL